MGLAVKSAGCRNMQAGVGLQQLIRKALQTNGAAPKQRSRAGSFTMKFGMVVMAVGELGLTSQLAALVSPMYCVSAVACLHVPAVCGASWQRYRPLCP